MSLNTNYKINKVILSELCIEHLKHSKYEDIILNVCKF